MNFISNRLCLLSKPCFRQNVMLIGKRCLADASDSQKSSKLRKLLQNIPKEKLNERDRNGWTALMLAAREGDHDVINLLLEKGSETETQTHSGHTAYDIAIFWQREEAAKLLKPAFLPDPGNNFFASDAIQRNSDNREKSDWVQKTVSKETSQFILMHRAKPLVTYGTKASPKARLAGRPSLMYKSYVDVHHLIADSMENLLYIGNWSREFDMDHIHVSKHVEKHVFAVDVSEHEERYMVQDLYPDSEVLDPFPGYLRLNHTDAGVAAQARSLLDWQHRYSHCPTCGSKVKRLNSGYKAQCTNKTCSSHKGESNTKYPRVDASVISAVVSRRDNYCLLGRQKTFPQGMYSCLAGFVEPGESIEQTCRREVFEEVGIYVQKVTYQSSQPWPMPSSLMIGCLADAEHDEDLKLDSGELEDARWFSRLEVALMLLQLHPDGFFLPPRQAIAHRLMNDWIVSSAFD